jgi:hypothetical protein
LFDPQLAEYLSRDWLIERAQIEESVEHAELEAMLVDGLIRQWRGKVGQQGFIPYSPRQAGIFKTLKATGRYALSELQHIAECWADYLDAVVISEPPYDDRSISDFEHFSRRVAENVSFFEEELKRGSERDELAARRLAEWQRAARLIAAKAERDLSDPLRHALQRQLWHLRWQDEFVRLIMAQKFENQLLQGYSVEVTFDGMSWRGGETTFSDINWESTFRRVREVRSEGQRFPLRLPDFNVTEKGVQLLKNLTPKQYSDLYLFCRMDKMFRVLEEMGSEIWVPAPPALGESICPECNEYFDRQRTTQIYCAERCRNRAKRRRWREKDPERARQCQARYWRSYGEDN